MPIIEFTHNKEHAPADAVWCDYHKVWTWKRLVGLCLEERERNGYDDSDFYMVYWDEVNNRPVETMFATTRGWSYPAMGSSVDATPEIRAKYEAYRAAEAEARRKESRRCKARLHRANRNLLRSAAERHGVPYGQMVKLRRLPEFTRILSLFSVRIRNKFKLKLREQVLQWVKDPAPKYDHPLSKKQRLYL